MVRLESERLIFRDHEPQDLGPFCDMESDPLYRGHQRVYPRDHLAQKFTQTWLPRKEMGLLATVLKENGQYIGRTGLYPRRTEDSVLVPREATLAFYLARPHWGQGFATEAGKAFVEYGFRDLGLLKIHAGMNAKNLASIRVIEKLGFKWIRSGGDEKTQWHDYELLVSDSRRP